VSAHVAASSFERLPNVSWLFVLGLRRRKLCERAALSSGFLLAALSGGLQN
jgi:hypothetical protein